jgi:two-component system sensor histidine kinase AtoS
MVNDKTRQLVSAQLELERTKRLSDIGTLAATVAHELRNPLGVIRTAVYNIKRKCQNQMLDSHIGNIEKKILESDQIINNLLGYSRIRTPQYEKIKLYEVLDECVNIAKERFDKKHVAFNKDTESIREQFMDGDHFQIREVLNNVLDNAGQAVEDGMGIVTVSAFSRGEGKVALTINDNGSGIEPSDIARLFEPFFTRKSKGTGLGLTVCKELINLHHGNIDIASELNKGTTVTITLPLERPAL